MKTFKEFLGEEKGSGMTKNGHPAFRNPDGELFKDKFGHFHIVAGGSHSRPNVIVFDPKWAAINAFGSFSPMHDKLVPWTKMVKKATVKKFISAIEIEMEQGHWFDGQSDKFSATQAIKYLKRMGR